MKQNDLEKIHRYIGGQADDKEKAWVESLFLNGEDNDSLRHLLANDWNAILSNNEQTEVDLSSLLDRVHHVIRKKENEKKQTAWRRFSGIYRKAAAILLLPLLVAGGLIYKYLSQEEIILPEQQVSTSIYAPMGARVSFNLPDGTIGMLNSGSHLKYSLPFNNDRQIQLEGEAWFEVKRDESHPFEISAGNSRVKVLGTKFNMSAYPSENYVEVVLQEGKVEFRENTGNEKTTLLPSERLVFRGGSISKAATDAAKYSAWTQGKMVFRNDPMDEVARRIERWYNVEVVLADRELANYSFRGTFEDDTLDEVLRLLSLTSPIRYKITPRKMMSDGSYMKEKVTIYLKKR